MPFGLTNAPSAFQHSINDLLRPYLNQFTAAYLLVDDILIYSNTLEEHQYHVSKILQILKGNDVHLKPEKWEFHQEGRILPRAQPLRPGGRSVPQAPTTSVTASIHRLHLALP